MSLPPVEIFDPTSAEAEELLRRPSLFLSASVPRKRDGLTDPWEIQRNMHYVATQHPERIRDAVGFLCRFAFQRDLTIIFGAHPAISPMVLEAALRFAPLGMPRKHVLIFQSAYFETDQIERATLDLADWSGGKLWWTERVPPAGVPDHTRSLTLMREIMVSAPGLVGAVFIGGMEGLLQESELFATAHPHKPRFAIGSTGSAAADLLAGQPHLHSGQRADASLLAREQSYPRVFQRIMEDLNLP